MRFPARMSAGGGVEGVVIDGTDDPLLEHFDFGIALVRDAVHHDGEDIPVAVLGMEVAADGADALNETALSEDAPAKIAKLRRAEAVIERSIHAGNRQAVEQRFFVLAEIVVSENAR